MTEASTGQETEQGSEQAGSSSRGTDATPTAPLEFPRSATGPTTYWEIWEYHGETPVRRVALRVWERGYVKQDQAEEDAAKLAADPRWTQFKDDPSFRVITVTTTRTPVEASTP